MSPPATPDPGALFLGGGDGFAVLIKVSAAIPFA